MADSDSKKADLTRIEDLSEFLHRDDSDLDGLLETANDNTGADQSNSDNEEEESFPPPFEFSTNQPNNDSHDSSINDSNDGFNNGLSDDFANENTHSFQNPNLADSDGEDSYQDESGPEETFSQDFDTTTDFSNDSSDNFDFPELPSTDELEGDIGSNIESENSFDDQNQFSLESSFEETTENSFEQNNLEESSFDQSTNDTSDDLNLSSDNEYNNDNEYNSDSKSNTDSFSIEEDYSAQVESALSHEASPRSDRSEQQQSQIPPRENFNEVQNFGNNITYGAVTSGGNPAFSILLKEIYCEEDHETILSVLGEHGLLNGNEEVFRQALKIGVLLIPQISEFSAIYLATKLRKYCLDIQVGPSEQIHPSKSYEKDGNKGLVTKRNIFQNKDKHYKKSLQEFTISDIILTKSSSVPGATIRDHIGVITKTQAISLGDLSKQTITTDIDKNSNERVSEESIGDKQIFEKLNHAITESAFHKGANAILSLSYNIIPTLEKDENDDIIYHVICTGDAVVLDKQLQS